MIDYEMIDYEKYRSYLELAETLFEIAGILFTMWNMYKVKLIAEKIILIIQNKNSKSFSFLYSLLDIIKLYLYMLFLYKNSEINPKLRYNLYCRMILSFLFPWYVFLFLADK